MAHPGTELVRQLFAATERKSVLEHRADMAQLTADVQAPAGVAVDRQRVAGCDAERLTPSAGAPDDLAVLYLHGGGYCVGDLNSHRDLAGRVALATGVAVTNLAYRLGPEDRFPAAIDDAVAAVRALTGTGAQVAIVGDSAGGGLALATALVLRDAGDAMPVALALISPWTDLTNSSPSHTSRADADPTVTTAGLIQMADAYLGDQDPYDPLASPVFADLRGLPPMRIDVGDAEILLDDSTTLASRAEAAGVEVDLHVWPELFHVFQAYPAEMVPETPESIERIATFLRSHLQPTR